MSRPTSASTPTGPPSCLSILPLRNRVLFPGHTAPTDVGRASSRQLLDEAVQLGLPIAVVAQRQAETDEPSAADLHPVGTLARVDRAGDAFLLHGISRIRWTALEPPSPYLRAQVVEEPEQDADVVEARGCRAELIRLARAASQAQGADPTQLDDLLVGFASLGAMVDWLAGQLPLSVMHAQRLLETPNPVDRARLLGQHLRTLANLPVPEPAAAGTPSTASLAQASSPSNGSLVYIPLAALGRDAFLQAAAERGWCFSLRGPSTLTSPESLTFLAGKTWLRYQHSPLLNASVLEVEDSPVGTALVDDLVGPGGRSGHAGGAVLAQALLTSLESVALEPVRQELLADQLAALFGLHVLRGPGVDGPRLHAALAARLRRVDAERGLLVSVAMSGVAGCVDCKDLIAQGVLPTDEPRLANFTQTWLQRRPVGPLSGWQARIEYGAGTMAAWRMPDGVSHVDVMRALWAAGYAPLQLADQAIYGLLHSVQVWFSGDGLRRVRYETCVETPVPVRLLYAEGTLPERLAADLGALGQRLQTADSLVDEVLQRPDGAQVVEGLAQVFQTALPGDAGRILPRLMPLAAHPDPRVQYTLLEAIGATGWPEAQPLLVALSRSRSAAVARLAREQLDEQGVQVRAGSDADTSAERAWPAASQRETLWFVPGVDRQPLLRALGRVRFLRWKPDDGGSDLYELRLRTLDARTSLRIVLDGVALGHVVAVSGDDRESIAERLRQAGLTPLSPQEIQQQCKRSRGSARKGWLLRERAIQRQSNS